MMSQLAPELMNGTWSDKTFDVFILFIHQTKYILKQLLLCLLY